MSRTVSVIVPAYNAAATIDATLDTVRRQSWADLDIIVIDDGSSDDTAARVARHAKEDARVRLLEKENGGVAAARNHGIAHARGDLIAPVDADDLCHPRKIERQVAALDAEGGDVGLVYSWFAIIDGDDRVTGLSDRPREDGDVLRRMCMGNLVGNGSVPLMRRDAVMEAGGYDPGLRAQQAQGCEDLKLYFSIAERWRFAVVPDFLLGYRWTPQNMSSDGRQMLRSYDLVMSPLRDRYPAFRREFRLGRAYMIDWLLTRAIRYGKRETARVLFAELRRESLGVTAGALRRMPRAIVKHRILKRPDRAGMLYREFAENESSG